MNKEADYIIFLLDRLRRLRKHLNLNLEELAEKTGLSFNQVQRIESKYSYKKNLVIKRGAEGRAVTLITLLKFYSSYVSLDALFNLNIPIEQIPLTKNIEKSIARERLIELSDKLNEIIDIFNDPKNGTEA